MGRELKILWLGRSRTDPGEVLCADYRQRIERSVTINDVCLKPEVRLDGRERLAAEAARLRAAAPDPCRWVVLDRRGKSLSSKAFAVELSRWREEWPHPIVFAIGSDLGVDDSLVTAAHLRWSLGPLTLPHSLARVVVYEQIYRALSLAAGIKYHRDPL
ncbi:MAG: 23S rRNA (pseudouridine(1915)-N(3))-methyltransferase RlmH [Thermoanaerobaculia bacterium]|nr:23S rRNA (pseudouridine(1915)-N(3))-methyltransferase RlmH [Thermoanaerobaculia bacterium]